MEGISAVYGSDGSFRLLALPSFDFIRGKGDWNDRKFAVFMGELSDIHREKPHMVFVFFSLLYILFAGKKEGRKIFIYPLLAECLTIFNPVFLGVLIRKFGFGNRYLRFFWMLLFYGVIAYAGVHLISRFKNVWMQTVGFLAAAALIVYLGTPVF